MTGLSPQPLWQAAPVSMTVPNYAEGAPGPLPLGTGETPYLNRLEKSRGLAASAPENPHPTPSSIHHLQNFPPPFCR